MRFRQAARSAPVSPAEMNLGMWKPYSGTHVVNEAATAALRSREARRAKTTSGAGQEPLSMAPMPGSLWRRSQTPSGSRIERLGQSQVRHR